MHWIFWAVACVSLNYFVFQILHSALFKFEHDVEMFTVTAIRFTTDEIQCLCFSLLTINNQTLSKNLLQLTHLFNIYYLLNIY
jgi:hypothetical protein